MSHLVKSRPRKTGRDTVRHSKDDRTVLIVEDYPKLHSELIHEITRCGWKVEVATTFDAADSYLKSHKPSVMIFDLVLEAWSFSCSDVKNNPIFVNFMSQFNEGIHPVSPRVGSASRPPIMIGMLILSAGLDGHYGGWFKSSEIFVCSAWYALLTKDIKSHDNVHNYGKSSTAMENFSRAVKDSLRKVTTGITKNVLWATYPDDKCRSVEKMVAQYNIRIFYAESYISARRYVDRRLHWSALIVNPALHPSVTEEERRVVEKIFGTRDLYCHSARLGIDLLEYFLNGRRVDNTAAYPCSKSDVFISRIINAGSEVLYETNGYECVVNFICRCANGSTIIR